MAETFYGIEDETLARSVRGVLLTSCVATGIITLCATLFYFISQPVIPLLYSLPRAEQALVPKLWIFALPAASLTITVVHTILISKFRDLDELILKMFAWVTVFLQILLIALLVRTISIIW